MMFYSIGVLAVLALVIFIVFDASLDDDRRKVK